MKKLIAFAMAAFIAFMMAGCNHEDTTDQKQRRQQEAMSAQASAATGMPAIHNFRERKLLKQILEDRDRGDLLTFTYVRDMSGKLHLFCESIGYPIPYATQYTNPSYLTQPYSGSQYQVLPQAGPNGLYSPAAAEGTWIMCIHPETKKPTVTYVEERVSVFPWRMEGKN